MLSFSGSLKVFVALEPCDMRKGFSGLVGLVNERLPASAMGKAISYALSSWQAMTPWLADGRIEIDNNLVENAIRPTAIGKKNWLFMGSAEAGQSSAILFTLIECCRRVRIDPFEYLRDVLDRIPSMTNQQIAELTPQAWAKARLPELRRAA